MSSVVTANQRKRLIERPPDDSPEEVLRERRLNDFYVRKALKRWLDSIEDINLILDKLPPEQLDKNEVLNSDMVLGLFKITEKLVKCFSPSPIAAPDENDIRRVFRHFKVELADPFQGMRTSTANVKVSYEATPEEVILFNSLAGHLGALEGICLHNERDPHRYEIKEFNDRILKQLQATRKDVKAETVSIVGFGVEKDITTDEASGQFCEADRQVLGKEPPK